MAKIGLRNTAWWKVDDLTFMFTSRKCPKHIFIHIFNHFHVL